MTTTAEWRPAESGKARKPETVSSPLFRALEVRMKDRTENLGKLILLYDSNGVTLSGTTSLTFTEDVGARYRAYGWHVQEVKDGNDVRKALSLGAKGILVASGVVKSGNPREAIKNLLEGLDISFDDLDKKMINSDKANGGSL